MKKKIAVAAFGLFAAVAAFAGPLDNTYVTASIGQSNYRTSADHLGVTSVDKHDISYGIGVGHRYNEYLSAEVVYNDLGALGLHRSSSGNTLRGYSLDATAVGTIPLAGVTQGLNAFGRVGLSSANLDGAGSDRHANGGLWGVGVSYKPTAWGQVSLRGEFNRYTNFADRGFKADNLSVGLSYDLK